MRSPARVLVVLLVLASVIPTYAGNDVITGKVVGVADGDTITILKDYTQIKIRLHGIDCPEKKQAFGTRAKQFTVDLVFGKTITIRPTAIDRYGRTVAWVFVEGKNLNEQIVEAGYAWHYKKYSKDANLAEAENEARAKKAGLWRDPHAIPPWEFRQMRKKQRALGYRVPAEQQSGWRLLRSVSDDGMLSAAKLSAGGANRV